MVSIILVTSKIWNVDSIVHVVNLTEIHINTYFENKSMAVAYYTYIFTNMVIL